ncbi:Hypothetical predicted protein [Xyrichtys novacula]|uniref:Uncharacterized protein n=1 Tax=Xyrichtys novacula TaxID=13765 RepID=A0AAV1FIH1_XYRNO|nr:Hypothetical predicted protein [Xyrichtys novacula]
MKVSAQQWTRSESHIPQTQPDTCCQTRGEDDDEEEEEEEEEEEPGAETEPCCSLLIRRVDEQTAVLLRTSGLYLSFLSFYTKMLTLDCNEITPHVPLCTLGRRGARERFHKATDRLSWSRCCQTCSNVQEK